MLVQAVFLCALAVFVPGFVSFGIKTRFVPVLKIPVFLPVLSRQRNDGHIKTSHPAYGFLSSGLPKTWFLPMDLSLAAASSRFQLAKPSGP